MRAAIKTVTLTCKTCSVSFVKRPRELKPGRGLFCSPACAYADKRKAKANRQYPKPTAEQKPRPVSPRDDDLPLVDHGSHVRCHRCGQPRLRGVACFRCEKWDCEGHPLGVSA